MMMIQMTLLSVTYFQDRGSQPQLSLRVDTMRRYVAWQMRHQDSCRSGHEMESTSGGRNQSVRGCPSESSFRRWCCRSLRPCSADCQLSYNTSTALICTYLRNLRNLGNLGNLGNLRNLRNLGNLGNLGNLRLLRNLGKHENSVSKLRLIIFPDWKSYRAEDFDVVLFRYRECCIWVSLCEREVKGGQERGGGKTRWREGKRGRGQGRKRGKGGEKWIGREKERMSWGREGWDGEGRDGKGKEGMGRGKEEMRWRRKGWGEGRKGMETEEEAVLSLLSVSMVSADVPEDNRHRDY